MVYHEPKAASRGTPATTSMMVGEFGKSTTKHHGASCVTELGHDTRRIAMVVDGA
ncbi:MAG: hypothetical protein NT094_04380 [Candidatus Staskawiczbacteria bacterium]|nr:hypothetical protein [Candidatus Staskawiczbacteria bacterium]